MPEPRPQRGHLIADAVRFGAVGTVSYLLDVAVFNALRIAPAGFLSEPLAAKTAGVVLATVAAWLGSRYWTFRRNLRPDPGREFLEFAVVAGAGYAANLIVLAVSHYALGFHSLIADNISGNVIGAALGAVVRFLLYRSWVYHPRRAKRPEAGAPQQASEPVRTRAGSRRRSPG